MSTEHTWYAPRDIAALCDARAHGDHYRARCPAHGGDNPQSLRIAAGTDKYGHPCTLITCFAHACSIQDICAALGLEVRDLFCMHPDYAKDVRNMPRSRGPSLVRLATLDAPTVDDMEEVMLIDMIIHDPSFLEECEPARAAFYRLAQVPAQQARLFTALKAARISIAPFWRQLCHAYTGGSNGD
jgi:hypothetical protein